MTKPPPEPLLSSALALTHAGMLCVTLANCRKATAEKLSSTERGSSSPPSHAQLRHAQQFSILSAIFCSTELVVCIELVFIFPNMIYKHNHVSDFDIALGCKAGTHPGPAAPVGSTTAKEELSVGIFPMWGWNIPMWGWILLSPTSPAPWGQAELSAEGRNSLLVMANQTKGCCTPNE